MGASIGIVIFLVAVIGLLILGIGMSEFRDGVCAGLTRVSTIDIYSKAESFIKDDSVQDLADRFST